MTLHVVYIDPANPQDAIDRLVGMGVLEPLLVSTGAAYRVVKPHVHEWRVQPWVVVSHALETPTLLDLVCACGETRTVGNRVPIEVPE